VRRSGGSYLWRGKDGGFPGNNKKEGTMDRKSWVILVVAIFMGMVLSVPGEGIGKEKVLIVGMNTGAIVSMDPAVCYEIEGHWMLNNIYDPLVKFKAGSASEIEPCMATSWDISGKTLTFTIRRGVKFSNGDPIDAEAVAYSLKRVVTLKKTPSWVLTQFGVTEDSIKTMGDKVQVTMDKPYSPSLVLSCMSFITGTVNPRVAEDEAKEGDMGSAYLTEHSAGSGPYVLVSWKRNEKIVLERNEYYWGQKPEIQRIIIIDVPESSSQVVQLKGGDIDIAWNLEYDQIPEIEATKGLSVLKSPLFKVIYLSMNPTHTPLGNVLVRRAIKSAIDYKGIVKAVGGGVMELHTFIPKGMFAHYDGQAFPYDPEKAKELLVQAGYPNGFDITLTVPDFLATAGTVVKSNLEAVGIKADLQLIAYSTLLGKYREQGLEVVLARWGSDYGDPDANAKPFAYCRTIGPDAKIKQLAWRNAYANPDFADMVEKAALIKDRDERERMYIDLQKKWQQDSVFAMLYQFSGHVGLKDKIKNFQLNALTETRLEYVTIED
jgi:peptide/nickel transport system substrate-binding protein